jgi:hypothetical protein
MARSKIALKDFLARHCRIHPSPASVDDDEYYVLQTGDGRHFTAESHVREILHAANQGPETMENAKKTGDFSNIIIVQWRDALEPGIEQIRIPVKWLDSLSEQQAFLILRHLEGIQKDVEDGRSLKMKLEDLFGDTATITTAVGEGNDRVFTIRGKLSASDHRHYMERYAEQVASKTLFDVAKALNHRLEQYVPLESRERFFVEGRDYSDKKIRYGEEISTDLLLTDEGAWVYSNIAGKSPHLREIISKHFRQAMLDPFGLSMQHYMGKHNVLKAGKRPLVKVPPLSSFMGWVKGLFGKKAA